MQSDILCFSHLRWDFVYQRPQHLLSRFSARHRVFYIEEPIFDGPLDHCSIRKIPDMNIWIVVPHLDAGMSPQEIINRQRLMMDDLIHKSGLEDYIAWYYTPMALPFTEGLNPRTIVYDCMDELSGFKFAPPDLVELENELMLTADVMFTGGNSLYQAKKAKHQNIYSFPSSIDKDHFMAARKDQPDPEDQQHIDHPRLGFFGVIDERFDHELIHQAALRRPDLNFIFIGPVVKIDPAALPRARNIHYLGGKSYSQLPQYLAGWDIAIMPFARNASTRYISPTKTPEYLSGGKPVISTSIHDVVNPYGLESLALIADTAEEFISSADELLSMDANARAAWLERVDEFLAEMSWDDTQGAMALLIQESIEKKIDHQKFLPYV